MNNEKELTAKQRQGKYGFSQAGVKERYDTFIDNMVRYGMNGALAVRETPGYSDSCARQTAQRLMSIDYIKEGIAKKMEEIKAENIANRKQRQNFWTRVMTNPDDKMTDRLRASELLGKSEADFTENYTDKTADQPEEFSDEERAELKYLAGLAENIKIHKPQAV